MSDFTQVGNGKYVRVAGSPYERGVAQGSAASSLISANIARYRKEFALYKFGPGEYEALLAQNLAFLKRTEPEYVEEMTGIADGSKLPFADILFINIPLYFILKYLPQECSSILARGKATFDGNTYLIKNRDYGGDRVEHVILQRDYPDGSSSVEINGAGMLTFPGNGLNSHGLAVSTSGVWSKRMKFDLVDVGRAHALLNASHILRRCRTVAEGIAYLKDVPRMSGMNFVLADRERAVAVEVTRTDLRVIEDEDGIIVRTNHYVHPDLAPLNSNPEEYGSTYARRERALSFLESKRGRIKFQDLLQIASDHENGPKNTICRHPETTEGAATIYSSLIVLEDAQVWTAICNPCAALRLAQL